MSILSRESLKKAAYPIGIAMALFQLYYTIGYGVLEGSLLAAIFLSFALTMIFLLHPAVKPREGRREPAFLLLVDLVLAACAIATSVYLYFNYEELQERMAYIDEVPAQAMALAYILVGLSLEATRRMTGLPLFTVAIAFFAYFLWGDHLPALIRHNGATLENIAENMYLTGEGVYGIPIMLACSTLFAFMMFGAFLEGSNMSSIFMDLAYRLTRKSQGGPAKVSIFASALFGTISGSSAGNVYTTGVFTIPLMKSCGYQPHFAGAVEAVASTGGQIMPPVMGAAAFMMAEFCGVSYLEVAKAALLPALLYYLALWVMIHFEARRRGLGLISSELVPSLRSILRRLYFLAPLVILVAVMIDGRSAAICANMATGSILLLSFFRRDTRFTLKRFFDTLYAAAASSLMVVACCAASGIVVGVINYTGIGFKFINVLTSLADGHLLIMLLLLMVTSFILGMGLPTTPGAGPACGPHVLLLLRHPFLHHAPGMRGRLRRGQHRRSRSHENGVHLHETRRGGLHCPGHVRVRAFPALAGEPVLLGRGHGNGHYRRHRPVRSIAELAAAGLHAPRADTASGRRTEPVLSRLHHRSDRFRLPGLRHCPPAYAQQKGPRSGSRRGMCPARGVGAFPAQSQ